MITIVHTALFALLACSEAPDAPEAPPSDGAAREEAPAEEADDKPVLDLAGTIVGPDPRGAKVLFVSVKDPSRPGPPLAAKQLPAGPFPLAFTLTEDDRIPMGAGRELPESVMLSVRLDRDGDAMTRDPGMASKTVTVASDAKGVQVDLAP
jgi:hypothetical protein